MNAKNLLKMEFIGLSIEIIDSENQSLIGLKGLIVDETKNTFIVQNDKKKVLLKSQIKFVFQQNNKKFVIDGKKICFRPEERIKKIK